MRVRKVSPFDVEDCPAASVSPAWVGPQQFQSRLDSDGEQVVAGLVEPPVVILGGRVVTVHVEVGPARGLRLLLAVESLQVIFEQPDGRLLVVLHEEEEEVAEPLQDGEEGLQLWCDLKKIGAIFHFFQHANPD